MGERCGRAYEAEEDDRRVQVRGEEGRLETADHGVDEGARRDEEAREPHGEASGLSMTAEPPRRSIAETMTFVQRPYQRKVRCAHLPQRTSTISRKVCALGALRLISMARTPKRSTWTEAPEAYQKGPERPKLHATFED